MDIQYYIIDNGVQRGPFAPSELKAIGLRPDSIVWRPGLEDWVQASSLPELFPLFEEESAFGAYAEAPTHAPGERPDEGYEGMDHGRSNPYYGDGGEYGRRQPNPGPGANYGGGYGSNYGGQNLNYGSQNNPNYGGQNPNYGYNYGYDRRGPGYQMPTNWMPWAIVSTILSFCLSCVGVVFGIIGIVQASKANDAYARGNVAEGDRANSTAKTMTIISLVLAAIGLIGSLTIYSVMGVPSMMGSFSI